jgi:hypothetical protein
MNTLWRFVRYAYDPWNWISNVSAATVQFATVVLVVKVFRKRAEAWLHRVAGKVLRPHLDAHLEAFKAHLSEELKKL